MSRRVILVHGFASPFSGKYDIDKLRPYFEAEDYKVVQFDYGFRFFVSLGNERWARRLAAESQPGDIAVGHSNGCLIIQKASLIGAPFSQIVFLAPALDTDAAVGLQVERIHVWHTPTDLAVRVGGFFPKHPWGAMGAEGYNGSDPRFTNYDRSSYRYRIRSFTHLDFLYQSSKLSYFGPLIVKALEKETAL